MAQLLVRNLENHLKEHLQQLARRHGRSMEEEAREILRNAVREEDPPAIGLGTQMAALFRDTGLKQDIPEMRGHVVTPATFEP